MPKIERSSSGRVKTITLRNPKAFIRDLHKSFRRCQRMKRGGDSPAKIGWAFYLAMCEMFGEPCSEESHVETVAMDPPPYPVAKPVKPR